MSRRKDEIWESIGAGLTILMAVFIGASAFKKMTGATDPPKKVHLYSCPSCQGQIRHGTTPCPHCGTPLSWPHRA